MRITNLAFDLVLSIVLSPIWVMAMICQFCWLRDGYNSPMW